MTSTTKENQGKISETEKSAGHDEILEIFRKITDLNANFIKSFEDLQNNKTVLPQELYNTMFCNLSKTYDLEYTHLSNEIEDKIYKEIIGFLAYEYGLEERRITLKCLEEKYQIKLPKIKRKKFRYLFYDPKHKPSFIKNNS